MNNDLGEWEANTYQAETGEERAEMPKENNIGANPGGEDSTEDDIVISYDWIYIEV